MAVIRAFSSSLPRGQQLIEWMEAHLELHYPNVRN